MLLSLCLIMGGGLSTPLGAETASGNFEGSFNLYSGALTEGDYVLCYGGAAMNTTVSSDRLQYEEVEPTGNVITNPNNSIVWHIAPSGEYWTIYNAAENKYAASTGAKNKAQLLASGTDDKSLWSVTSSASSTSYDFTNKQNTASSVNATLRRNGTYGFACYATATGGALTLYKRADDTTVNPHASYYKDADGKKGSALKTAMCGIIFDHTELGYDDLWTAYRTTDVRSDGKIWDMYSNITNYDPVADSHSNSAEGSGFNREHSFPKSWFGGEIMPMFTDLHHLYPVDGNINTRRSNYPFGETNGEEFKSANDFSKLGACTYPGYSGTVFEPADEYKGDFARTYFYMVTCYEEKLPDWYANNSTTEVVHVIDGTTYPGLQAWQLDMLMKWAKNDPVSEKETNRNNAVYAKQGNRNPFIDYPGLQEYIWGYLTDSEFSNENYQQPVYLNFSMSEAEAALGTDFTEPTLTTNPAGLTVTYSSSDETVATVDAGTGEVTLVADGSTTITATFAGNDSYNVGTASYKLTVGEPALAMGATLLYEGLTRYSSTGDSSSELTKSSDYLNYGNWASLSKVYPGGTDKAFGSNGGCLKFGSGSAVGSMTTGSISLSGGGTLTFYLKRYGSDTGQLNITVTGATADVTQFTPASDWTLCTVNLTNATGSVTIKLETTTKRAYVDEIKLLGYGKLDLFYDRNNLENVVAAATNATAVGCKYNVTLQGRTLWKDGDWNTLCLPFSLSAEQLAASDLSGADIRTLSNASFADGTLTLTFTPAYDAGNPGNGAVTSITAGTPYILKWPAGNHIVNPEFAGVTISNETHPVVIPDVVTFAGTYNARVFTDIDRSILFVGSENSLYCPQNGVRIGAQCAYFQLDGIIAGEKESAIKHFVLNFDGDKTDGMKPVFGSSEEAWYTLDGRKLSQKPSKNGIYINNGRKVVIK